MRPRAIPRPRLSQGRLNVSIVGRPNNADALDRRGAGELIPKGGSSGGRGNPCRRLEPLAPRRPKTRRDRATTPAARPKSAGGRGRRLGKTGSAVARRGGSVGVEAKDPVHTRSSIGGLPHTRGGGPRRLRPEIRRDYPLNLSILISGGKETNQDSPSNGE